VLPRALARRFLRMQRRQRPAAPRRVLVAQHLLTGDVLMLTPLLAKLRQRHPDADIAITARRAVAPLFSGRPYGVRALLYEPREPATLKALFEEPGFDLAFVPGDNRYSWLAAAAGARWIVAFGGDRPASKSWPVDESHSYSSAPAAWGDMVADLAEGAPPHPYRPQDWPAPACAPFDAPSGRYAVLHVEASTPLKQWDGAKWLTLAGLLARSGIQPIWSAGLTGSALLHGIDPAGRFKALGHRLDLAQLWHLVSRAALLVCPDTSAMHIGRLTGTPTVGLFGPSSAELFGPGEFWRNVPYRAVTIADFPCRDQHRLFKREISWVQRCQRTPAECAAPRCMQAIEADGVAQAAFEIARP
ncbi:MAG: glycosyltransferase family 9 protein, partial [Candidatus Parcubacteria bacterium]|nr:glycosyltransferase family 9 protein [Burkholderiales bacterium]